MKPSNSTLMPRFAIVTNPLEPINSCQFYERPNTTVRQFIAEMSFDMAGKICVIDSIPTEERDFDRVYPEESIIILCPAIGWNFVVYAIVAIVVALATYLLMPMPPTGAPSAEADPVYTLRGQRNQARLGEAIERHYGKTRHWPSYMSRPYNQFHENDQYLYALLCIGLGRYEVHKVQVEDTDIADFDDVEWEIYQPGEKVTLFPTNVQTSSEVAGITLYGPNEEDFEGWSGPFVANSAGSIAHKIQLDFSCRQGLFSMTKKGGYQDTSVTFRAEYRLIDDSGAAIGSWTLLEEVTKTNDTERPRRFTISQSVADGRYEVRCKRITDKSDSPRVRDEIHWEGLRAFCDIDQAFGNVTLLAIKAKATDNLNDSSQSGFNVITTSILPTYDKLTGEWTRVATRNPAWAALDILRADYGRRLKKHMIDLNAFADLANSFDDDGIRFDGTFDNRGTVWEALQTVLSVGRAAPILTSGIVSFIRDVPRPYATLGFNGNNIAAGSLQLSTKLAKRADYDGIEIEYVDGDTWKRRTVKCLLDGDRGRNMRKVKLTGVTDRDKAYRWGMYHRAVEVYHKDSITFETGLEGGTAKAGDLIAIRHDLLSASEDYLQEESGRLAPNAFGTASGGTVSTILLPFEPTFIPGEIHRIAIRDRWGLIRGPYVCHPDGSNSRKVVLDVLLELSDINVAEGNEQPTFWFGLSGSEYTLCKILKLEASGLHRIKVTAVPYDDRIYSFDTLTAPELDSDYIVPKPEDMKAVTNLTIKRFPRSLKDYTVSWSPVFGASSYTVSKSLDGINYRAVDTTTKASIVLTLENGEVWIRVRAINKGAGPAAVLNVILSDPTEAPEQPDPPTLSEDVHDSFELEWPDVVEATSYKVKVYFGYGTTLYLGSKTVVRPKCSVTKEWLKKWCDRRGMAFFGRQFSFTVTASNSHGSSAASTVATFEKPDLLGQIPTGLTNTNLGGGTYRLSWSSAGFKDGMYFQVYVSSTSGFMPPSGGTLRANQTALYHDYTPAALPRYWRVIVDDDWGDTGTVYMSAQKTIS